MIGRRNLEVRIMEERVGKFMCKLRSFVEGWFGGRMREVIYGVEWRGNKNWERVMGCIVIGLLIRIVRLKVVVCRI